MIRLTITLLFLTTLAMANPLTLGYKPIKPFYFNTAPYPQPFARPDNPDGTYNKKTTTDNTVDTTVDLRFKSTTPTTTTTTTTTTNTFVPYPPNSIRPPFYPDGRPYPEPVIPAENTGSTNEDRFKPTTMYTTPRPPQSSVNTLEYIPIRPPFYPDGRPYPEPIIPPGTQQPTYQPTIILLSTTPSELNMNSIVPIQVIPVLIPDDETFIDPVTKTTEKIPNRFGETTSTSKPISLEYIPMRPPFYPGGQSYPQPNPGNPKPTRDTTTESDSYRPSPSPVLQITSSVGFVPVSSTYSAGTMETTKPTKPAEVTDIMETEVRLADEPFTTQPLGENTPFTSRTNPKYTDKLKPTTTLPAFTNKPIETVGNRDRTSQRPKITTKWDDDAIIFPDD